MPATPSPKHGITRPADTDFINTWPALLRAVVDWIDPNVATFSTASPRPAAGVSGRWHRAASGALSFDTGAAWVDVPWGSVAARLAAGGSDPLTVTAAMLGADVPIPEIGVQLPTASSVLPANGKWAWCDGSLIRADLYPVFAAGVGNAYNNGASPGNDGSGNPLVRLPNKLGRGSIGAGSGAGLSNRVRGAKVGVETVALTTAQIPNHAHGMNPQYTGVSVDDFGVTGDWGIPIWGGGGATFGAGGGGTHDNMSPAEVDNWIVRIA